MSFLFSSFQLFLTSIICLPSRPYDSYLNTSLDIISSSVLHVDLSDQISSLLISHAHLSLYLDLFVQLSSLMISYAHLFVYLDNFKTYIKCSLSYVKVRIVLTFIFVISTSFIIWPLIVFYNLTHDLSLIRQTK